MDYLSDVQESAELGEPPQTDSDRVLILKAEIKTFYGHYRKTRGESFKHVAEIGKRLNEVKDIVGHDNWGQWIRSPTNCPFSERSAQLYMKLAKGVAAGFEYAKFADLGIVAYVAAYTKELKVREREEAGEPDEPEPKPKQKKNLRGPFDKRKGLIQGNELRLPEPFRSGKIFHVTWRLERGYNHCDIYVWHSWEWNDEERYHWIYLCYKEDGDFVTGGHEASWPLPGTRQEVQEMLERVATKELDDTGKPIFYRVSTEEWIIEDRLSFIVLEGWQHSIQLDRVLKRD